MFHYDAQYQLSENFRVSPKVAFTLKIRFKTFHVNTSLLSFGYFLQRLYLKLNIGVISEGFSTLSTKIKLGYECVKHSEYLPG